MGQPVDQAGDIYSLGILLYELLTGQKPFAGAHGAHLIHRHLHDPLPLVSERLPAFAPQVDAVIQRATAKNPADRYAEARELARDFGLALRGQALIETPISPAPARITNPYKGLRPFQENDADDFFGRRALIEQLLARLAHSPFLAVVGPSGSGKSSAVKAGLIPSLRKGFLPGSDKWFVAEMVPGRHPLEALEQALWPVAVNPPPSLVEPMARGSRGVLRTVRRILPDEDKATLLLIIDQFEELFTLVDNRPRRDHFIDSILTALAEPGSPLRVVITMRADFYDRPLQQQALGRWLKENTEVVLPLSPEELVAAISKPAARVGVVPEEGLVAAIAADLRDEPGMLPLLQYTLTELFTQRENGRMTLATYEGIGGTSGALARRAEDLYTDLGPTGQDAVRQLFLRLVNLGEGSEDSRRRVLRAELIGIAGSLIASDSSETALRPEAVVENVLELFGRYRLLTFDHDPVTRAPTVEVAHEALMHQWPRLRGWLDEGREDIRLQRLLANGATEWHASDMKAGYLLRGARLQHFENWAADNRMALSGEEQAYLQASLAARDRREAEAVARRAREEALEARSRNRLRYLVGVLAAAAVLATILSLLAINFARRMQAEARVAISRELAAAAVSNLEVDPERSVLLALAGLDAIHTIEAENALHRALPELHLLQTLTGHDQIVESLAISPDGSRLASAAYGTVIVWEVATGEEIHRFSASDDIIFGMDFTPDGRKLITASEDQLARIWDSVTGAQLGQIDHGSSLSAVSVSPDGSRLVTAGADAVARVWDMASGRQIMALRGHAESIRAGSLHPGGVISVAFTPDGQWIITGGADGTVRLWNAANGKVMSVLSEHTNEVYIAPGPDGNHMLTAGFDGQVIIWDIAPDKPTPERVLSLYHADEPVRAAAFSPDGKTVAVAGQDGAATVWDATSGQRLLRLVGHQGLVDDLTFTRDGNKLVTAAEDQTVKVWDMAPERERLTIADGNPLHVAYHPGGEQLATAHPDGTIRIRDSATGQALLTLPGHPDLPEESALYLTFSPDGMILASSSWDRTARLWDVGSGELMLTLAGHDGFVWQTAFSPDGARVVTAGQDGSAKIWDTTTGKELFALSNDQRQVLDVAYSPDGRRIAVAGCPNSTVAIWDGVNGQLLELLETGNCLNSVAFSPDGRRLAAGRTDGAAVILDLSETIGQVVHTLTGHTGLIQRLAFSPDGERLATASFDGTAKVWNLDTGQEWLTLRVSDWLTDIAFSPDGKELATAGRDGLVRIWVLELDELIALARSRLTRSLTEEECQKFLHVASCP
jgi:WD40 repeat protein